MGIECLLEHLPDKPDWLFLNSLNPAVVGGIEYEWHL